MFARQQIALEEIMKGKQYTDESKNCSFMEITATRRLVSEVVERFLTATHRYTL